MAPPQVLQFPRAASAAVENEKAVETPLIDEQGRGALAEAVLRIGMPRALHEKLRAVAALRRRPATLLVRETLEQTPPIDPSAPFAELRTIALGIGPVRSERVKTEIRMQVPLPEEVHVRLHQFAALRGQTLGAFLADLIQAVAH